MSEMIDAIDVATGERLDTLPRHQIHAEGHWHQVFHCLVVRPSSGSIVLQQRSRTKAAFPGKLDLTVTGHLAAGETPLDGVREAEEELGVAVEPSDLLFVGNRLLANDNGEGRNRERIHLYFLDDDRPLSAYSPPPDEVSDLVEITAADFLTALGPNAAELRVPCQRRNDGPSTMSRQDLVAGSSGYWITLAVMAARHLAGESPIAI